MQWQGNAGLRTVPTALAFTSLTLIFIALNFDLHEFVSLFLCVWTSFIAKWAVICQYAKMWCRLCLPCDGWSHSQIGVHFGKSKSWAKCVLAAYSEKSLSPKVVQKRGKKRKTNNVEDMIIVGMGQHLFKESYKKLTAMINFQRTDKFSSEQRSRRMGEVLVTASGSSRIPCSEYQHRAVIFLADCIRTVLSHS